jgi:hypothetical protein
MEESDMHKTSLILSLVLTGVACTHSVRLPRGDLSTACASGFCRGVPYPAHGLEWDEVVVENHNGGRERLGKDGISMAALTDPRVECVEFRRNTLGSGAVGVLVGGLVGSLAGATVGANATGRGDGFLPDFRGWLAGSAIGWLAGATVGGVVGHSVHGPESYPDNRCR